MWYILIPLITGLICAILGYLIGKSNVSNTKEYDEKIATLEHKLNLCESKTKKLNVTGYESLHSKQPSNNLKTSSDFVFNAEEAQTIFGKKIKPNDLTVIEGIGPKIKDLFHNFEINTWEKLSQTTVDKCQEVLNSGGERYRIHKPGTWPKQAGFAAQNKWKELKEWQNQLKGGK